MNLSQYIPFLSWIKEYKKEWLSGDIIAGLTVGVILIPQGIAYANIAGLPPQYGLYAALIPQIIYAFFGTSRHLAVGPQAMDSLLIASIVSVLAKNETHYIELAIMLALVMGTIQLLLGILKFGFVVHFLSKPVIYGFIIAAASIITVNQFKHLLGLNIPKFNSDGELLKSNTLQSVFKQLFEYFEPLNWIVVLISILSLIILIGLKKINKKIPASLIVVIIGIALVYFFQLNEKGVPIVKEIKSGLPTFQFRFQWEDIKSLIPPAFILALIAFMEAITISKGIEDKDKTYKVEANQELVALGLSNIGGSFFSSYPVTGSFSRSAINYESGGKTGISSLFSVLLIVVTLLFLTDFFYFLPKAILGAIIVIGVSGFFNLKLVKNLYRISKIEFLLFLVTLFSTLLIGVQEGIILGIIFSLAFLIYNVSHPHIAVIGKIKDTNQYKNITRYSEIEIDEEILIMRFDARLFYTNIDYFKKNIDKHIIRKGITLKHIIIAGDGINGIDYSGVKMLEELYENLKSSNIQLHFVNLKGPVRDALVKSDFVKTIGKNYFHLSIDDAVFFIKEGKISPNSEIAHQSN